MSDLKEKIKKLGGVEDALVMPSAETYRLYQHYLNFIQSKVIRFMGLDVRFVEAKGGYLRDENGREYLDFISGFGALNLGHEPPEILEALHRVEDRPNFMQVMLNPCAAKLAEYLAVVTPGDLCRTFFCNSGTEAVEAAIKLARISTGRKVLLFTDGAYHGKTFGSLSVSGRKKYKTPYEPLLPGTEGIAFDDLAALRERLSKGDVAGFIVEPIQGENGVIVPQDGYLREAQKLCNQNGTLLIVDEIQTGMGRTGKLFCCDHEEVVPDILVLSKSLGGGVMPIGAIVTRDWIWKKAHGTLATALLHSSTFGGNTRACAAGIAAVKAIIEKDLPARAQKMGDYLLTELRKMQGHYSILQAVRGKGLMIGLGFSKLKGNTALVEGAITLWIGRRLLKKHGIITAFTLNNLDALRIAPPLTVEEKDIEYFLTSLKETLKSAETFKFLHLLK